MLRDMCSECGLEIKRYDKSCPRCGCTKFDKAPPEPKTANIKAMNGGYVEHLLRRSDCYITSKVKCICGGNHYMVYPAHRSEYDYNKKDRLTNLPVCPNKFFDHSRIDVTLHAVLADTKIEG